MPYLPVKAGLWQQKELWDGTYTITDLFEILPTVRQKMLESAMGHMTGGLLKNV